MRSIFLTILFVAFSSACAHVTDDTISQNRPSLSVSLAMSGESHIGISIINLAAEDVCLPKDYLENPASYGMDISLKLNGKKVKKRNLGIVQIPLQGDILIKNQSNIYSKYFLSNRFLIDRKNITKNDTLEASVDFKYRLCSSNVLIDFKSGYQKL
jgi:hypothetical protein